MMGQGWGQGTSSLSPSPPDRVTLHRPPALPIRGLASLSPLVPGRLWLPSSGLLKRWVRKVVVGAVAPAGRGQAAEDWRPPAGLVEVEEGEVNGQELSITSHSIARISFAKEPHVEQVSLPLQPSLLPPRTCSPQRGHRSPLGLSAPSCGRSPHMLRWGCATAESGPWQVGT